MTLKKKKKKATSTLPGLSIALVPAEFKAAENDQKFISRPARELEENCLKS